MLVGIDHVVIVCADPDTAAAELEATAGLACTGGGRHDGLGTYNRIAWFADGAYLELIGVEDRHAALEHPVGAAAVRMLDERGAGLATYALADDDLVTTVHSRRAAGSSYGAPQRGARRRPDGEVVEWSISVPPEPLVPDSIPFLIEHVYGGAEWGPAALAARAAAVHPLGSAVSFVGLEIPAHDPVAAARRIGDELGIAVAVDPDAQGAEVRIRRHSVRFRRKRVTWEPAAVILAADVPERRLVEPVGIRVQIVPAGPPA